MKRNLKTILSLVLCICMCISMGHPAYAANESNILGITFSATLDTPTISVSDEDQTIVMQVNASEGMILEGIQADVVWDSPLSLVSITNSDERIDFSGSVNLENGRILWSDDNLAQLEDVTNIAVVTFTVPANTPAGTYTVGVQDILLSKDYGDEWETSADASVTLTITDTTVVEGYTAGLTTLTDEVSVGDSVAVNVGVFHSEDTFFAAGEIVISYDNTKVTFNESESTLGSATIKDNTGTLILEDYGANKNTGTGVYVLAFDAISDGNTTVTMTSAAFVDKEGAAKSDLIMATFSPVTVDLTVNKKSFAVTLPDIFAGSTTVVEGGTYTFAVADSENYDYESVTATMDGQSVDVVDNGDGTYTIENVTGALVITGTRTEKSYNVTFSGNAAEEITDGDAVATYNTNYSFTMPSVTGWAYSLESITIGDEAYTGYTVANSVYTIPGSAINGDIVITVNKSATIASVTVEGTGAGAAAGYEVNAKIGEAYTLTIVPESGYTYTVTATMSEEAATIMDNGDNTYTIEKVIGNIIFNVERVVMVDGVTISNYLTLDGSIMWLVKNDVTLADGKVPTYNGDKMYWSEQYGTYCYLVVAETLSTEEATLEIGITDGTVSAIESDMDVNKTGKIDASDAQLTYNMYNAAYTGITDEVTIEKYLCADVNADGKVDVTDATVIIADILK